MTGVYAIRHKVSGRVYVGSSLDVHGRWSSHTKALIKGRHHSVHLQRAWTKYGSDAFEFVVLEWCDADERVAREQVYIDLYRASDRAHGFNMSPRADSPTSSPEVAAKVSASLMGRTLSVAHRANMATAQRGKTVSAETRAKMSHAHRNPSPEIRAKLAAGQLGRRLSAEAREKISAKNRGKARSPETRAKMSEATKRQFASPEAREQQAARLRGRKLTVETRAKMSESLRRRHINNPVSAETRAKLSAVARGNKSFLGRHHSASTRMKMSLAQRNRRPERSQAEETIH